MHWCRFVGARAQLRLGSAGVDRSGVLQLYERLVHLRPRRALAGAAVAGDGPWHPKQVLMRGKVQAAPSGTPSCEKRRTIGCVDVLRSDRGDTKHRLPQR